LLHRFDLFEPPIRVRVRDRVKVRVKVRVKFRVRVESLGDLSEPFTV